MVKFWHIWSLQAWNFHFLKHFWGQFEDFILIFWTFLYFSHLTLLIFGHHSSSSVCSSCYLSVGAIKGKLKLLGICTLILQWCQCAGVHVDQANVPVKMGAPLGQDNVVPTHKLCNNIRCHIMPIKRLLWLETLTRKTHIRMTGIWTFLYPKICYKSSFLIAYYYFFIH